MVSCEHPPSKLTVGGCLQWEAIIQARSGHTPYKAIIIQLFRVYLWQASICACCQSSIHLRVLVMITTETACTQVPWPPTVLYVLQRLWLYVLSERPASVVHYTNFTGVIPHSIDTRTHHNMTETIEFTTRYSVFKAHNTFTTPHF